MNGCCWALYNELGAQWTTWTNNAEWGNLHGHGGGLPVGHIRFTHNYAANGIGFFTNVPPDPIDVILQNNTTIPDRPTGRDVPDQILASAGLTGRYRSLTTDQGPVVQSFEPRSGAATAATQVLITGRGFQPGTTVSWGSTRATSVEVLSSNFVRATAPAGTPLAQLTITTPRGTVTAPEPRPIDEQFDAAAISNDWSPQNGEMENTGGKTYSYSAQELAAAGAAPGAKIVHDGLEFTWPSAPIGEPDAVQSRGQAIEVEGNGDTLGFLYAGLSAVSGTGTVLYRDGTQQSYEIDAGAWNDLTPGKEVVLTTTVNEHTYRREDPDEPFPVYVYYASVPLDPSKEVAAVVLPFTAWPNAAPLRSEEGSKIIDVFAIAVGHGEGGG
jgi:IPT/TIG domain-containing protein